MNENKSIGSQVTGLVALVVAAIFLILFSPSCGADLNREFGPSSLHGTGGQLPGVVITTKAAGH